MSKHDKSVTDHIDGVIKEASEKAQDHIASASQTLTELAHARAEDIADLAQSGADSIATALGEHRRRHRGAVIFGLAAAALVLGLALKAWTSRTTQ